MMHTSCKGWKKFLRLKDNLLIYLLVLCYDASVLLRNLAIDLFYRDCVLTS